MPPRPPTINKPFEFLAPMRLYAAPDEFGKFRLSKKRDGVEKSVGTYSTWEECFMVGTKIAATEEQKDIDFGINAWIHRA